MRKPNIFTSINIISVSRIAVIEKASLEYIPLEYVFTGISIKFPMPANSIISGIFSIITSLEKPRSIPDKIIFSLPESSFLNPTPIDSNEIECPCRSISPLSAEKIPAIARSIVDFPLPFFPVIPRICPSGTSKETFLTA